MLANNFQPCLFQPTRHVPKEPSLIDNIFVNDVENQILSGNLVEKISDHMPNFIITENTLNIGRPSKVKARDFKNFNQANFIKDLGEKLENFISSPYKDIVKAYRTFQETFLEVLNKHSPLKTLSRREQRQKRKSSITKGIQKSIKVKNIYYHKFVKTSDVFCFKRYKFYRDMLNYLIRKSQRLHYKGIFDNSTTTCKEMWKTIGKPKLLTKENVKIWKT